MTGVAAGGQQWVNRVWYGRSRGFVPLMPLTWLYAAVIAVRRFLYRHRLLPIHRVGVPVIVIGNLTVGGTGKTPLTIWLVAALRARGFNPGVASRGYRGSVGRSPQLVHADSDAAVVGDEPVLIARRCQCPVAVHPDRVAAARLLAREGVDVVIADDGLQHYRLGRDAEIAVVDGERGFGNGRLLPAGPLREPLSRLAGVDQILVNGGRSAGAASTVTGGLPVNFFELRATEARRLDGNSVPLSSLAGSTVHAIAAIGNPERFFAMLEAVGIDVIATPLRDHAGIEARDMDFDDDLQVVMTEKDAVKCGLQSDGVWYVPVDVVMDDDRWLDRIESRIGRSGADG